jgi:hypothetical protein
MGETPEVARNESAAVPMSKPQRIKMWAVAAWTAWDKTVGRVAAIVGKTAAIFAAIASIVQGVVLLFPQAPDCYFKQIEFADLRRCVGSKPELASDLRFLETHVGRMVEWKGELQIELKKYRAMDSTNQDVELFVETWTKQMLPKGVDTPVPCRNAFPSALTAKSYADYWWERPRGTHIRIVGAIQKLTADELLLSDCLVIPA